MSVRNAILGLLSQHPRHGYELRTAFHALVGGEDVWEVKPAQIYSTLARLEEGGLVRQEGVEQDGGPEKHIYSLTSEGMAELETWYATGIPVDHERDEFFVKLMVCLETAPQHCRDAIQAQRRELYQELHAHTARRSHISPKTELAQILLLDKAIMHIEADLRWLDMIEGRLEDIRSQPRPEPPIKPRGRPRRGASE